MYARAGFCEELEEDWGVRDEEREMKSVEDSKKPCKPDNRHLTKCIKLFKWYSAL